ncbi:hypothetical protein BUE80_DR005154 [Diplocarpon rosae]|nr:hypothetical protein BUE80_DR005154 [Diplocarpon rosae]
MRASILFVTLSSLAAGISATCWPHSGSCQYCAGYPACEVEHTCSSPGMTVDVTHHEDVIGGHGGCDPGDTWHQVTDKWNCCN